MREVVSMSNKIFGINKDELFHPISINAVRKIDGKDPIFKADSEGQFDYMVYLALTMMSNAEGRFSTTINIIVKELSYKPKYGKGKINNKVQESLNRLVTEYNLVEYIEDEKVMYGRVLTSVNDGSFFKLKRSDVNKILGNHLVRLSKDDYTNKYNDKAKVLYLYSYLMSMMSNEKKTTEVTVSWSGCFPSTEQICEDCNICINFLYKMLSYMEMDMIIFTTNIGAVKGPDGTCKIANNYYTNNIKYISSSYIYARAYYDSKGLKYYKYKKQTKKILDEISDLLEESYSKFKKDKKDTRIRCFKEHYGLLVKDTLYEFKDIFPGISRESFDKYMENESYLKSDFYDSRYKTSLYFIADNELAAIPLLTHIKNKIKGIMYLYDVRRT